MKKRRAPHNPLYESGLKRSLFIHQLERDGAQFCTLARAAGGADPSRNCHLRPNYGAELIAGERLSSGQGLRIFGVDLVKQSGWGTRPAQSRSRSEFYNRWGITNPLAESPKAFDGDRYLLSGISRIRVRIARNSLAVSAVPSRLKCSSTWSSRLVT